MAHTPGLWRRKYEASPNLTAGCKRVPMTEAGEDDIFDAVVSCLAAIAKAEPPASEVECKPRGTT